MKTQLEAELRALQLSRADSLHNYLAKWDSDAQAWRVAHYPRHRGMFRRGYSL